MAGERITIDNSVLAAVGCAFRVTKSGTQAIDRITETTLTWDTESYDDGANFAANTFTAPSTGWYALALGYYFSEALADGNLCYSYFAVGGTKVAQDERHVSSASAIACTFSLPTVKLTAADTVIAGVYHNNVNATRLISNSTVYTWFQGRLLSL